MQDWMVRNRQKWTQTSFTRECFQLDRTTYHLDEDMKTSKEIDICVFLFSLFHLHWWFHMNHFPPVSVYSLDSFHAPSRVREFSHCLNLYWWNCLNLKENCFPPNFRISERKINIRMKLRIKIAKLRKGSESMGSPGRDHRHGGEVDTIRGQSLFL